MTTYRPPTKPSTYFIWGLLTMALIAALLFGIYFYGGGMASSGQAKAAEDELKSARGQILLLEEEKENLQSMNLQLKQDFDAYKVSQREKLAEVKRKQPESSGPGLEIREDEEQVQFVASRLSMDLQGLAKQIHEIEGVQVQVLDSGLLVSGVASPFTLGSSQIRDDSLIPKLKEIADTLNKRSQETGTRFYPAAIGNTDITPVRDGSLWGSNLWLGAHRARTLADLMIENGFAEDDVFLISWGTIRASDEVRDPESRRPEIFIVTEDFFEQSKERP
jgi:flagellar motor protein MotB